MISNMRLRNASACASKLQPVRRVQGTTKNRPPDKAAGCPFYLAYRLSLALHPLRSRTKARETSPKSAKVRRPSSRCSLRRTCNKKVGGLHRCCCFCIDGRADRAPLVCKIFVVGMRWEERMRCSLFAARTVERDPAGRRFWRQRGEKYWCRERVDWRTRWPSRPHLEAQPRHHVSDVIDDLGRQRTAAPMLLIAS